MTYSRREAIRNIAGATGLVSGFSPTSLLAQQPPNDHDDAQPFTAWCFLVDVTTSIDPFQFDALRRSFIKILDKSVSANDRVWIGEIGAGLTRMKGFSIPPSSTRRSTRNQDEADRIAAARRRVAGMIQGMTQRARSTNLREPIERALGVLNDQVTATQRILLAGSDFITDAPGQPVTPTPPAIRVVSATHDRVVLIVAEPSQDDARKLRMSSEEIYRAIVTRWSQYFNGLGTKSVTARHLQSIDV